MGAQPTLGTSEDNIIEMYKQPVIEGKQYIEDPKLEKIAKQVIEAKKINCGPASIGYMLVYPNISKYTGAKCVKCSALVKHFSGLDFVIQISGEMWDMLDDETREILLWHQLLHIDATFKTKTREWKYSIRKHDYADFYEINDTLGSRWYKTIQATISSLYDLDPKQESRVKV